ncbi:hypothetical protein LP100_06855 [Moraxella bovis]|uniref:hypothetical protein n=1 Tax=Moraxella bovis TaxID=476 RepID=UPI0022263811|nr:hypothetical protein [Moraxella bovis]UZA47379.1 hypothetical protein LP100_06855 [Moraxella bovis]
MKLTNLTDNRHVDLSDDLYSVDELNWSKVVSTHNRMLDGTLLIEQAVRKHGKPYVLTARDDMAWVTRAVANRLQAWASLPNTKFKLSYHQDGMDKEMTVMFDHTDDPMRATPVKGHNSPNLDDYFNIELRFVQVE